MNSITADRQKDLEKRYPKTAHRIAILEQAAIYDEKDRQITYPRQEQEDATADQFVARMRHISGVPNPESIGMHVYSFDIDLTLEMSEDTHLENMVSFRSSIRSVCRRQAMLSAHVQIDTLLNNVPQWKVWDSLQTSAFPKKCWALQVDFSVVLPLRISVTTASGTALSLWRADGRTCGPRQEALDASKPNAMGERA